MPWFRAASWSSSVEIPIERDYPPGAIWRQALALVALTASLPAGRIAAPPRNVDVSNARGPQNEPSIAIDPRHPNVLLAGSRSVSERTDRIYTSADGGATWQSRPGPPLAPGRATCASD